MKRFSKLLCSFGAIAIVLEPLFLVLLITAPVKAAGLPVINSVAQNVTTLKRYEEVELTVDFTASYTNPFRSYTSNEVYRNDAKTQTGTGVALDAFITTPSNTIIKVPGFYDVHYKKTGVQGDGSDLLAVDSAGHWNIKYSPREAGRFTYYVQVTDQYGTAKYASKEFTATTEVNPLAPHGFLRKSVTNPGYLEYDDGTPFTEFGVTGADDSTLVGLGANGGNFIREWLTNGSYSSIFRNTTNPWISNGSKSFVTESPQDGAVALKVIASSLAANSYLVEQGSIGASANSCYASSIYVKTGGDFSGSITLKNMSSTGKVWASTESITTANQAWKKLSVAPFKMPSTAKALFLDVKVNSTTSGTVWFDNATVYETVIDSAGACTSTPKYATNQYNMLWDPSFEADHVNGDPAHLNMVNLARFDITLATAEQNNIVVQPCIFDHRVWGDAANSHSNWAPFFQYDLKDSSGNPVYEFWTDSFSKSQAKDVLRYLMARYSSSPAIGLWELGNEATPNYSDNPQSWYTDMGKYIHDNDPAKHLVTTSFWYSPGDYRYEQNDQLDVGQVHYYMNDDSRGTNRPIDADEYIWAVKRTNTVESVYHQGTNGRERPWLSGEFGLMGNRIDSTGTVRNADLSSWDDPGNTTWQDTKTRHDTKGIFFHNGVWSMLTANAFKSSVSNWWNPPFDTWNYKQHYLAPSGFSKDVPFHDDQAKRLTTYSDDYILNSGYLVTSSNTDIRVLGRSKNSSAYLWVQNKNNTWANVVKDNMLIPVTAETGKITIPGFAAGTYKVAFYDTYAGGIINQTTATADNGNIALDISLSAEKPDTAIIITPTTLQVPAITVTQSTEIADGGAAAHQGDGVVFNLYIKNNSNETQTANIKDTVSTNYVTNLAANPTASITLDATANKATVTWPAFTVLANQTATLKITGNIIKTVTPPPPSGNLISNLTVSNGKTYVVAKPVLNVDPYYIDRDYTLNSIPSVLNDSSVEWIKTANADRYATGDGFVKFTLGQNSDIYIVRNPHTAAPAWLAGWEKLDTQVITNHPQEVGKYLDVYKKSFTAGEISLGANYGDINSDMYVVAVKPGATTLPTGNISAISVSNGKTYESAKLTVGSTYYTNRDYTLTTIPASLSADTVEWIKTNNDDEQLTGTSFLKFTIAQNSFVYVARNPNTADPAWLTGWTVLPDTITTNHAMENATGLKIFSKWFPKGEVTLGANYGTSISDMYIVAVKPGEPLTMKFGTVADAYVSSNKPSANYGTSTYLMADSKPVNNSFLQFDLSSIQRPVTKATLYLTVGSYGSISGGSISKIASNSWSEKTITYSNQPSLTNSLLLATIGTATIGKVYGIDVIKAVTGPGIYSFAITSKSSDTVNYYSKEASDQTKRPYLVLEFAN